MSKQGLCYLFILRHYAATHSNGHFWRLSCYNSESLRPLKFCAQEVVGVVKTQCALPLVFYPGSLDNSRHILGNYFQSSHFFFFFFFYQLTASFHLVTFAVSSMPHKDSSLPPLLLRILTWRLVLWMDCPSTSDSCTSQTVLLSI